MQSTIDAFNKQGSKVFVAFLDCTKTFDRISHHGLFFDSCRDLDVVKVLKLITPRHGVISFSTFTNSNDPFIIDFPPKTSLRKKSDNVSFDWNLFLIEGQVK